MTTDIVLDALEQALYARHLERDPSLIQHRDRGSQYVLIRYNERLKEAGVEPSTGLPATRMSAEPGLGKQCTCRDHQPALQG